MYPVCTTTLRFLTLYSNIYPGLAKLSLANQDFHWNLIFNLQIMKPLIIFLIKCLCVSLLWIVMACCFVISLLMWDIKYINMGADILIALLEDD
jgi:hypothetical protein